MVESVPVYVEFAIVGYLLLVAAVGCYLQARVWRGKRRQALEGGAGEDGTPE